jgi:DNA-binding ferritin-like protein
MEIPHVYSSDVAFSPSVKGVQACKGSRAAHRRVEEREGYDDAATTSLLENYLDEPEKRIWFLYEVGRRG